MTNSGDFSIENFQLNFDDYLNEIGVELKAVQSEQSNLKTVLNQDDKLREEMRQTLSEHSNLDNVHLVENLKLQLRSVVNEKEDLMKLFQNASSTVEKLEHELIVYQENTQGYVPKTKLIEKSYEEKLNVLQDSVAKTKSQLQETIQIKSKELLVKDNETVQTQTQSATIIQNLEQEILNLQNRLIRANEMREQLEMDVRKRQQEASFLKDNVMECKLKVEEAVQVVETALNEKDAALLREAEARVEITKLSEALNEVIEETGRKIKLMKMEYDREIDELKKGFQLNQEIIQNKTLEIENCNKKYNLLELDFERMKKCGLNMGDLSCTKLLTLEKNLEDTFQKLLLSEKQNIKLNSEIESIKNDIKQMAQFYERDINMREVEKEVLKKENIKLKCELESSQSQVAKTSEMVNSLKKKLSDMEMHFKEQLDDTKKSFQQTCKDRGEMENMHQQMVQELQNQLKSQSDINKKWRNETKNITDQLEIVILELKEANVKMKHENRVLNERLKEANGRMSEYRKFLEMISRDVSKITSITIPEFPI